VGIFSKICPRCAGENAVSDSRCQCGFVFDASAKTGSYQASEIALQEAEVYAEYLQVRMRQAREVAEVAIADQARSPQDAVKSSAAAEADSEYKAAKEEYDQQMKFVVQLRIESRATLHAETRKMQRAARIMAVEKAKKARAVPKPKPAKPAAATTQVKAPVKSAPAKPQPARAPHANIGHSTPPPSMRQKLAHAGENAANRARQQRSVAKVTSSTTQPGKAASTTVKPDTIAARSATKTVAPAKAVKPTEKECPHCTSLVALSVRECKCGFSFAQGAEQMDGVGLSDEDRTLLGLFTP
jgi:hypothetical protein